MSPLDVLRALRDSGAIVVLRPDNTIQCRAPDGVLTQALVTAMRQHKEELLTMLEWYEERAGLLEYDGGLGRAEAEHEAWRHLVERAFKRENGGTHEGKHCHATSRRAETA